MTLAALSDRAGAEQLDVFGAFHTAPDDPAGHGTLVLLGPREPGFWPHVTAAPEFRDGEADPLDRWSRRVITGLAAEFGAEPLFPFGEPLRPFMSWAIASGRAWASPVGILVHETAGLMVSYRGALLVPGRLDLPAVPDMPCSRCDGQPCRSACPAGALAPGHYDLDACHAFLDTGPGQDCLSRGCAVRRACPISRKYRRLEAQSAFHMERFHP